MSGPRNRQVHLSKNCTVWAKATATSDPLNRIFFDLTSTVYGELDFTPDAFVVKTSSYISNNEQNKDEIPIITCNFVEGKNPDVILDVMSANGSISHPNTLYTYNKDVPTNNVSFLLFNLINQGVYSPGALTKSTWMMTIEFIQYSEDPEFS